MSLTLKDLAKGFAGLASVVKQIWTLHCNGDGPFYEAHIKTKSRSSALREEGVVTHTAPVVLSRLDIYADLFRPGLWLAFASKRAVRGSVGASSTAAVDDGKTVSEWNSLGRYCGRDLLRSPAVLRCECKTR